MKDIGAPRADDGHNSLTSILRLLATSVHSAPHSFMVMSDPRTTAIFTHCIEVISCHQSTKAGDFGAMTAMTLLDDSRNWGHFWKIESAHGERQRPTRATLSPRAREAAPPPRSRGRGSSRWARRGRRRLLARAARSAKRPASRAPCGGGGGPRRHLAARAGAGGRRAGAAGARAGAAASGLAASGERGRAAFPASRPRRRARRQAPP